MLIRAMLHDVSAMVSVCVCYKSFYGTMWSTTFQEDYVDSSLPLLYESTRATHGAMRYRQNRWHVRAFAAYNKNIFFVHNLSPEISGTYLERQTRTMFCGVMPAVFNVCRDYTPPWVRKPLKF